MNMLPRVLLAATGLLAGVSTVSGLTLNDICEVSYVQNALPYNVEVGLELDKASVALDIVTNYTGLDGNEYTFCDLNFTYSHAGRNDQVMVNYWLPDPSTFKNRYLSTGGAGFKSRLIRRNLDCFPCDTTPEKTEELG